MAAERKLRSEIDRTLKKVQEGQEVFEGLWDQVRSGVRAQYACTHVQARACVCVHASACAFAASIHTCMLAGARAWQAKLGSC